MSSGRAQHPPRRPGGRAGAASRVPDADVEAARVARALAVWTVEHRPGLTRDEDHIRGLALGMRRQVGRAIAEGHRIGMTTAEIQADLEEQLRAAYRGRGWVA